MIFKKETGVKSFAPLVFVITCLRVYSFIPFEKLFFEVYERTITDIPHFLATIALCVIFSLLLALFSGKLLKENSALAPLLLLFIADPVFFSSQENISMLALSSLFVLCLYIFLFTSNLLIDSVASCVTVFFYSLLFPDSIYSIIPVLLGIVIIKYYGSFCEQKLKTLVFIVLNALSLVSAYLINHQYGREVFLVNKFLNGKTTYLYKPSYLMLVFSVIIFIGCVLLIYKISVFTKAKAKNKKYEYLNEDSASVIYLTGILIIVCFALQIFARLTVVTLPSYIAMNISAPVLIIFTVVRHKNSFDNIFNSISDFWSKHFALCFISFMIFAMIYFKLSGDCFEAANILKYATLYLT